MPVTFPNAWILLLFGEVAGPSNIIAEAFHGSRTYMKNLGESWTVVYYLPTFSMSASTHNTKIAIGW